MAQRTTGWRDQLRYRFENTLSKGAIAIIGWLALVSIVIVVVAGALLALLHVVQDPANPADTFNFGEATWHSLMRTLDAGNIDGDAGWTLRAVMLVVTLGGIFIVSTLIGTITAGLEATLEELRKGRSRVIEQDYTLILGWSSKVYSIIKELVIANGNRARPRIVILADRDKVEMEDDIRAKLPDTGTTRVICRSGDPLDLDDLAVVDPDAARSIVVLAPEVESPDLHVIKSVLAITNNPQRRAAPYHIVAEIRDEENLEAAALVGGDEAIFIQGDDLIARVTAQTCRQSGLSVVYTELLDFDGAEIYMQEEPGLTGRTYREALGAYEESALMGLRRAGGEVLINPPMDTRFAAGDQVIAISEDDDTVVLSGSPAPTPRAEAIMTATPRASAPERTLILGWNGKGEAIIRELDQYVAPNSMVVVLAQGDGLREAVDVLGKRLQRQVLRYIDGDPSSRATLKVVFVEKFDHIILLSNTHLPMQEADAKTLIALLHLRNLAQSSGRDLSIVSEMLDVRNRTLAQVAKADDFIVSDQLVSLMLSQLSENKHLDPVFRTLFSAEGSEIYIRPVTDYLRAGVPVDFHTAIEAAARRGETAIGYRLIEHAQDAARGYGVKINPKKSAPVTFGERDQLIVLAED